MSLLTRATDAFALARAKAPWLDHLVQAGQRYGADQGNQYAAAITYFSFLSLFPLLLLTVSVLGFVLSGHPELTARVIKGISDALPGQSKEVINGVIDSRRAVGLVGLLGLLYSGLGWVGNLRTAIRTVWHQNVNAGNIVTSKLHDLVILAGLGVALVASVAVSGIGNAATSFVIKQLGLTGVPGSGVLTKLVTIAIAMVADVVIFLYLFIRLPRVQTPWRRVIKGAVFAAVGFEILKLIGAFYIARTTDNATATYGTLGVVIGALVWINLVCRFVIFSAVWTVTAPYDDDVAPSGTADPGTAKEAGIPTEFAQDTAATPEGGVDATPGVRQLDGAPTPLTPALSGKAGVGYGALHNGGAPAGHRGDPAASDGGALIGRRGDRDTGAGGMAAGEGAGTRVGSGATAPQPRGGIRVLDPVPSRPRPAPVPAGSPPGRTQLAAAATVGAAAALGMRALWERFRG